MAALEPTATATPRQEGGVPIRDDVLSVQQPAVSNVLPPAGYFLAGYPSPFREQAPAVIYCESRWRADAVSETNDYGLGQIHFPVHGWRVDWDASRLLDPATNIYIMWQLWSEQGWTPWAASRHCHGLS